MDQIIRNRTEFDCSAEAGGWISCYSNCTGKMAKTGQSPWETHMGQLCRILRVFVSSAKVFSTFQQKVIFTLITLSAFIFPTLATFFQEYVADGDADVWSAEACYACLVLIHCHLRSCCHHELFTHWNIKNTLRSCVGKVWLYVNISISYFVVVRVNWNAALAILYEAEL